MTGFATKRSRPWDRPTEDQFKAAEHAAFSAIHQGQAILVSRNKLINSRDDTITMKRPLSSAQDTAQNDHVSNLAEKSVDDFLFGFRVNGLECMTTAYQMRHPVRASSISGALTTSLPEDVFHLVDMQITLLHEFVSAKGIADKDIGNNTVVDAVCSIVNNLSYHHTRYSVSFLQSLESSIAAGNDLMRMLEKKEGMQRRLKVCFPLLDWDELEQGDSQTSIVRREFAEIARLYSNDAVNASQRAVNFVMQSVQSSNIANDLFSREWEDIMVHNEVALSIVKTISDYLSDIRQYVEHPFLYHKIVASLVRGTVCFYTQCFVKKAHTIRRVMKRDFANKRAQRLAFVSSKRTIMRITYDVEVFQNFFNQLAKGNTTLSRLITDELFVLVILIECMWLAVSGTNESLDEFILVVHQKISGADSAVTRHFLSDIWLLLGPKNEYHMIEQEVKSMEVDLQLLSARVNERESTNACQTLAVSSSTSMRLDQVLKCLYEDRITEEALSLCGSLVRLAKVGENRSSNDKNWEPLERIKRHFAADKKYERELSTMFQEL